MAETEKATNRLKSDSPTPTKFSTVCCCVTATIVSNLASTKFSTTLRWGPKYHLSTVPGYLRNQGNKFSRHASGSYFKKYFEVLSFLFLKKKY